MPIVSRRRRCASFTEAAAPEATAADGARIVTAGDDGKIVATDGDGETRVLVSDPKRRWIDRVALGPDGAVAWSAGKTAYVQAKAANKQLREFEAPSTVGALAFSAGQFADQQMAGILLLINTRLNHRCPKI